VSAKELAYRLEVAILPVADIDRSLAFYRDRAGFSLDVDYRPSAEFRVVQLTPARSSTSIQLVADAAPRSHEMYLVVEDLEAARQHLTTGGVDVGAIRHKSPKESWAGGWELGIDPEHGDYASFADFTDPDGHVWTLQERNHQSR
jgi:catechol 2,3-dioxygenase-like lactoylglutathione lyase family enzyme